jgi:hypothetical protein
VAEFPLCHFVPLECTKLHFDQAETFSTLSQPMSNPLCDNPAMKMNRRHQISRKAGILGTCRRLLLLAVRRVKEEDRCRYSQEELPWDSPFEAYSVPVLSAHRAIPLNRAQLPSEDALRVKSAEFWLKLGEVDEALRELGEPGVVLPKWRCPIPRVRFPANRIHMDLFWSTWTGLLESRQKPELPGLDWFLDGVRVEFYARTLAVSWRDCGASGC